MTRRRLLLGLAVALAGCAAPTPYAPAEGDGPGWTARMIEPGRWRVRFLGNSATSRDAVEAALLRRAAETTLEAGGGHFRLVSREIERQPIWRDREVFEPLGGWSRRHGGRGTVRIVSPPPAARYEAVAEILVRPGPKPEGDAESYDARAVLAAIGVPSSG